MKKITSRYPDDIEMAPIMFYAPLQLRTLLKAHCATRNIRMQDGLGEAIEKYLGVHEFLDSIKKKPLSE